MQIFDEVKKIEQEAADLELDYQNKLRKLEQNTQDKIGEMKRNIEKELATFQSEELAKKVLVCDEVYILVDLKSGSFSAAAYGCDLTYDYVKINGDYRT